MERAGADKDPADEVKDSAESPLQRPESTSVASVDLDSLIQVHRSAQMWCSRHFMFNVAYPSTWTDSNRLGG